MIVVIDDDSRRRDISEAILAKLRFAVAPFESVDQAVSAMRALRPEAVVAREDAAAAIRGRLPNDREAAPFLFCPSPTTWPHRRRWWKRSVVC